MTLEDLINPPEDTRIVYAANCTWWDSVDKAVRGPRGLPGCPNCYSVLYEMPSEEGWWEAIERTGEELGKPHYKEFIESIRGKCFVGPLAIVNATTYYEELMTKWQHA